MWRDRTVTLALGAALRHGCVDGAMTWHLCRATCAGATKGLSRQAGWRDKG